MAWNEEVFNTLREIVNGYEETNKDKDSLIYETLDENGNFVKRRCTLEAAYAYQYVNDYGDKILNLVLVYEGWTKLLQDIAMEGIHRGTDDKIGADIWVYTLNKEDFDLDENSMLLYKDTMILRDDKGLFASLKDENTSYKKVKTMV